LSRNPNAIHLLEKNIDKINWFELSRNPNAIPLLEKHLDKIDWHALSVNPNVIYLLATLDTQKMRENCCSFSEELVKYVFHPMRLMRLSIQYHFDLYEYTDLI